MSQASFPQASCFPTALLSIGASLLILGLKFYAAHICHSAALRSDAIESVVNVLAAVFALGAILFADKPVDLKHPYGYGKIEHFSAGIEGGIVSLASVIIGYQAIQSLLAPSSLERLGMGLTINLVAGACNGLLGLFLIRTGRSKRSQALEADGQHVLADFYVTLGLALSLALVAVTGLRWLDPIIALGVSGILAFTGFKLVATSGSALLDTQDLQVLERLVASMNKVRPRDILDVHRLKTLGSGRRTYADVHIVVPEYYGLSQSHHRAEAFAQDVIRDAGIEGELRTHVDPCERSYCERCAVELCPVRQHPQGVGSALELRQAVSPHPLLWPSNDLSLGSSNDLHPSVAPGVLHGSQAFRGLPKSEEAEAHP